jgi:hypothetical protein
MSVDLESTPIKTHVINRIQQYACLLQTCVCQVLHASEDSYELGAPEHLISISLRLSMSDFPAVAMLRGDAR